MNKTSLVKSGFLMAAGSLLLGGCVYREREVRYQSPPPVVAPGAEVEVQGPPPPNEVDTVTVSPGPGFIWIGGFQEWGPGGWHWHAGYWGRPPRAGMRWYGPHYVYHGRRHVWVRGGWR